MKSPSARAWATARPDEELRLAMGPARSQLLRQGIIDRLSAGAVAAVFAPAGVLLFSRFRPVMDLWFWCGLTALAAIAVALAAALGRRPSWSRVAVAIDAAGLAERTVTALWSGRLDQAAVPSDTARAFIVAERRDALRSLGEFDPAKGLPLRWPTRIWRPLAAGLVAVLVLAAWPNPMAAVAEQREAVRKAIAGQAKTVEKVQMDVQKASADRPPKATAELQKTLEELLKELKKAGSAEEALKALSQAQEKLAEQASAAVEQAAAAGDGRSLADLASEMKGSQAGKAAGEKIAAGDPAGAKQELDKLAQAASQLSQGDRQQLAQALDRAAKSGSGQGQVAKAAGQAAKDVAGSDASGSASASLQALGSAVQSAMSSAAAGKAIAGAQSALQASQAAVAAAGQSSSAVAQGGSGQGGQGGQGGGSGAGSGSTNTDAGQGNEASNQSGSTNPSGASGNKTGTYEKLYDPSRLGGTGETSVVGGQAGKGPSDTVDSEQNAAGPGSLRPYDELYAAYSQEARTAIDGTYVPVSLRDLIKEYFSSLDPGAGQ